MRFFAFLCVFFYHCLPGNDVGSHVGSGRVIALVETTVRRSGESGVGLFFLLSAFLITELLRREKAISGSINLTKFYLRRSLRIWPLYYLAIAIGLGLQAFSPTFKLSSGSLLSYVFFVKNWDVALHGFNWNPIYILWTISAEEQFYLFWPLAQKMLTRRRMLLTCAGCIAVLLAVAFWPHGLFLQRHSTQMVYLFIYFPVGGILSFVLQGDREPLGWSRCAGLALAGAGLWLGGTLLAFPNGDIEGALPMLVVGKLVIVVGTVLIFLAFLRSGPLWPRPFIYLGRISYGLYVFHVMALFFAVKITGLFGMPALATHSLRATLLALGVRLPLAMGVTVGLSVLSYEFFEKRFLRLKDRLAFIHTKPA
jgi:peptidoglycan/LPS O-acetylase OafA/YrhL